MSWEWLFQIVTSIELRVGPAEDKLIFKMSSDSMEGRGERTTLSQNSKLHLGVWSSHLSQGVNWAPVSMNQTGNLFGGVMEIAQEESSAKWKRDQSCLSHKAFGEKKEQPPYYNRITSMIILPLPPTSISLWMPLEIIRSIFSITSLLPTNDVGGVWI